MRYEKPCLSIFADETEDVITLSPSTNPGDGTGMGEGGSGDQFGM